MAPRRRPPSLAPAGVQPGRCQQPHRTATTEACGTPTAACGCRLTVRALGAAAASAECCSRVREGRQNPAALAVCLFGAFCWAPRTLIVVSLYLSLDECVFSAMLKSVKSKLAGQDKAPRTSSSASQAPPPPPSARNSSGPTSTSAAAAPAPSANRMASSQASRGTSGSAAQRPYTAPGFNAANCAAAYAETLPSFRDVSAAERQALFVKKLHLCSYTFDFTGELTGCALVE